MTLTARGRERNQICRDSSVLWTASCGHGRTHLGSRWHRACAQDMSTSAPHALRLGGGTNMTGADADTKPSVYSVLLIACDSEQITHREKAQLEPWSWWKSTCSNMEITSSIVSSWKPNAIYKVGKRSTVSLKCPNRQTGDGCTLLVICVNSSQFGPPTIIHWNSSWLCLRRVCWNVSTVLLIWKEYIG